MIEKWKKYLEKINLKLNLYKTKIMRFRKRGGKQKDMEVKREGDKRSKGV